VRAGRAISWGLLAVATLAPAGDRPVDERFRRAASRIHRMALGAGDIFVRAARRKRGVLRVVELPSRREHVRAMTGVAAAAVGPGIELRPVRRPVTIRAFALRREEQVAEPAGRAHQR